MSAAQLEAEIPVKEGSVRGPPCICLPADEDERLFFSRATARRKGTDHGKNPTQGSSVLDALAES